MRYRWSVFERSSLLSGEIDIEDVDAPAFREDLRFGAGSVWVLRKFGMKFGKTGFSMFFCGYSSLTYWRWHCSSTKLFVCWLKERLKRWPIISTCIISFKAWERAGQDKIWIYSCHGKVRKLRHWLTWSRARLIGRWRQAVTNWSTDCEKVLRPTISPFPRVRWVLWIG